jgi:subtilisin family serine protease
MITPQEAREIHGWELVPPKGETVTVAVMDSGIDEEVAKIHPWFASAELTKQFDATGHGTGEDAVGHGTGCASIIANAVSEVELYDVRIFGGSGASSGYAPVRRAYNWLIDHADEIDVVNMSWGGQRDVPQINNLHERLISKGVVDVVAAGNTGGDGGSPATAERAFSAGAIDENEDPTRFSSFDPDKGNPDVAAVGQNVQMARANGTAMGTPLSDKYVKSSGTSFAAPYVTAAYVNALYHNRQNWDEAFMDTGRDIPGTPKDGGGVLLLDEALGGDKKK